MLAALIIYLIKKLWKFISGKAVKLSKTNVRTLNAIILFISLGMGVIHSQEEKQSFEVQRNGKSIGFIEIRKNIKKNLKTYNLISKIKAKLVFTLDVYSEEKTIFKNDKLVFSWVYRRYNKKEKVNQQLRQFNGEYLLFSKGKSKAVNVPTILYNLHSLYFEEPKPGINEIYCDNLVSMVRLWRIDDRKIKVEFPNGDYNVFTYENGLCVKVEVYKAFYKVQLIPVISYES